MDPALWGWTATDNGLRPVSTDIDPAPEALIKLTDAIISLIALVPVDIAVDLPVKTQLPTLKMRMKKLSMTIPSMPSN